MRKYVLLLLLVLFPAQLLTAQDADQVLMIYVSQDELQEGLYLMQPDGSDLRRFDPYQFSDGRFITQASLSPDGTMLAFVDFIGGELEGHGEISILNLMDGSTAPVTPNTEVHNGRPTWSPDGRYLAYISSESGTGVPDINIYDVTEQTTFVLVENGIIGYLGNNRYAAVGTIGQFDWSPDGQQLVIFSQDPGNMDENLLPINHLIVMNRDGTNAQVVTPDDREVFQPVWSSDPNLIYMVCRNFDVSDICSVNLQTLAIQTVFTLRDHPSIDPGNGDIRGIDLLSNHDIIFQVDINGAIYRLDITSGTVVKITEPTLSSRDWFSLRGVFTAPVVE